MTPEQQEFNRKQLYTCFFDLGKRAAELNEPYISSISLILAGSILDRSDAAFSIFCAEFAKFRMNQIRQEIEENEDFS